MNLVMLNYRLATICEQSITRKSRETIFQSDNVFLCVGDEVWSHGRQVKLVEV